MITVDEWFEVLLYFLVRICHSSAQQLTQLCNNIKTGVLLHLEQEPEQ